MRSSPYDDQVRRATKAKQKLRAGKGVFSLTANEAAAYYDINHNLTGTLTMGTSLIAMIYLVPKIWRFVSTNFDFLNLSQTIQTAMNRSENAAAGPAQEIAGRFDNPQGRRGHSDAYAPLEEVRPPDYRQLVDATAANPSW
jgi:hypothetical protein